MRQAGTLVRTWKDSTRWVTIGVMALVVALVAVAAPVTAGEDESKPYDTRKISGDSVGSDCGGFAIELSGDLNGCLDITPEKYKCHEKNGFALYKEWGSEVFTASDEKGTFETRYKLTATFSSGFCNPSSDIYLDFSAQLTGGCLHKIVDGSGTGKFEGVDGKLRFFDVIPDPGESGASNFLYAGYLTYSG